jgi:glycosyltransferase involved in cell wall biosynthesis
MRLIYLLLSPTFGMHQYTADLANRQAAQPGNEVHLVTTANLPRDRYSPAVRIHTPVVTHGTGFSREGLNLPALRRVLQIIDQIAAGSGQRGPERGQRSEDTLHSPLPTPHSPPPTPHSPLPTLHSPPPTPHSPLPTPHSPLPTPHSPLPTPHSPLPTPHSPPPTVHLPAVHLWNLALAPALRRRGYRVIQTLHDLDPHAGVRFPALIRLWNRLMLRSVDRVLVHGQRYRQRLLAQGIAPGRVTAAPLLHGFLSYEAGRAAEALEPASVASQPWALFFGRLEVYKGVGTLLEAARLAQPAGQAPLRLLLAGQGELARLWDGPLPAGVEVRARHIDDAEALDLFRRCGLLVLPYLDATQSALVAAAYIFGKPVIVTRSGALPEYVQEGVTGWIVPPGQAAALAQALQAALADPARLAVMGAAGRQWYQAQRVEEFQALLELYQG